MAIRITDHLNPLWAVVILAAACGGEKDPVKPPEGGEPASLAIQAGNSQSAAVGTAVAVNPAVIVKDASGNPVSGVSVQFAVSQGGGSLGSTSAQTNQGGIASPGAWTLGPNVGPQALRASLTSGTIAAVTFAATATPEDEDGDELITQTIPTGGGTIQVTTSGHPLQGLKLSIPSGSFTSPGDWSVRVVPNATAPTLPTGYRVSGPIVEVATTQGRGSRLMTLTLPVTRTAGEDIVLALHDPVSRVTEVLPTTARSAASVTVMTTHLRGDLLLGPGIGAGLRTGRTKLAWLMPVAFPVPQPPVSVPELSWPVLDHGSTTSPNGFGSAIPALIALASARAEQGFLNQVRPLATPGFYAEAAPMAIASRIWARQKSLLRGLTGDLATAMQPLPKAERDEMVHRNILASVALSSSKAMMTAFTSDGTEGSELFGNVVEGSEESLDIVHPALVTKRVKIRRRTTGYDPAPVPVTPDQPMRTMNGLLPISSFLLPYEDVSNDWRDLTSTLTLPQDSPERNVRNRMLASLEGLKPPTMELRLSPTEAWYRYTTDPIVIRGESTEIRSTDNDPPTLAIHDNLGQMIAIAAAAPVKTQAIAGALPTGNPTNLVFSGITELAVGLRQSAAATVSVVRAPFQIEPEHPEFAPGTNEVTVDAAVPYPPDGGYRIRWNWGDGNITEVTNEIRGVHEYEQRADRSIVATLLPATSEIVLAVDTARVIYGQPYWRVTSFTGTEEFLATFSDTDDDDEAEIEEIALLMRALAAPEAAMLALVQGGTTTQLQLRVRKTTLWTDQLCCPPAAFSGFVEWLLPLGTNPPIVKPVGPYFAGWETTHLNQTSASLDEGVMTGQYVPATVPYPIKGQGTQTGPAGGFRIVATRDGDTVTGTISLYMWWIEYEDDDDQTGEVSNPPEVFEFQFTAERP